MLEVLQGPMGGEADGFFWADEFCVSTADSDAAQGQLTGPTHVAAVYHFRTTHFTIVPSEKGNLLVIDGDEGQRILKEIESRRADYYRREYDFMPQDDTVEQHRNRFKWLHREGALSEDELRQRLALVDASDSARIEAMGSPEGAMLN